MNKQRTLTFPVRQLNTDQSVRDVSQNFIHMYQIVGVILMIRKEKRTLISYRCAPCAMCALRKDIDNRHRSDGVPSDPDLGRD